MSTPFQREMLSQLAELDFKPVGYDATDRVIAEHSSGFRLTITPKADGNRRAENTLAVAKRGIELQAKAGPQFARWFFEKHEIQPGESRKIVFSVADELRKFASETHFHGMSRTNVNNWMRTSPDSPFKNVTPELGGKARRTWLVTRPRDEVARKFDPVVRSVLNGDSPDPPVQTEPVSAEEAMAGQVKEVVEGARSLTPPVLSDDMLQQLANVFQAPLQHEVSEARDRLELTVTELEQLHERLGQQLDELTQTRDMIMGLIQIAKG